MIGDLLRAFIEALAILAARALGASLPPGATITRVYTGDAHEGFRLYIDWSIQ